MNIYIPFIPLPPQRILCLACFFGIFHPGRGSSGAPFAFPIWGKIKGRKEAERLPQVQIGGREELRWRVGMIELLNKSGGQIRWTPVCSYSYQDSGDRQYPSSSPAFTIRVISAS